MSDQAFLSYQEAFSSRSDSNDWTQEMRQAAFGTFESLGLPHSKQEEWRFTNINPLKQTRFAWLNGNAKAVTAADIVPYQLEDFDGHTLVFVNGQYADSLSTIQALPEGVYVGSLAGAIAAEHEVAKITLGKRVNYSDQPFAALNTALMQDGAFVYVPKNTKLDSAIHIVFISNFSEVADQAAMFHPRNLYVVESSGQCCIVETYTSLASKSYFNNSVTEVVLADNAICDHYKLQHEGLEAYHISSTQVYQARSSRFSSHSASFGGSITRNDIKSRLDDEGIECILNGIFYAHHKQLVDNHTFIDHAKPNCNSWEHYKGILTDQSRGVFNGRIFVRQDAQKTDAKQSNNNLLLSEEAIINTKPQLEIFADDVKCTHGCTVGQLVDDALFYMRSRGIDKKTASNMLTYAFAAEVVADIEYEPVRRRLEQTLSTALRG